MAAYRGRSTWSLGAEMSVPPIVRIALTVASSAIAACAYADDRKLGPNELVLVHEVRIAFYIAARPKTAASMGRAVTEACVARPTVKSASDASAAAASTTRAWLCAGGHLYYLRAVNVLGDKYQIGYVCANVSPDIKFYTPDMFLENRECVVVTFDARTNRHSIVAKESAAE
jgi:hypothetical protein